MSAPLPDAQLRDVEPAPRIFGAMCTFDRPADLRRSLDVLESQSRSVDALVIVDNGGGDSVERVVARHPLADRIPVEIIDPGANLGPAGGYAAAFNRIDELAGPDDLFLVLDDDDPPPSSTTILDLVHAADDAFSEDDVAGVGLRGGSLDLRTGVIAPRPTASTIEDADHLHGGLLPMYRMRALRQSNVFDGALFWGFDDLELGRRLTRDGWRIRVAGDVYSTIDTPRTRQRSVRLAERSWRHYFRHRNLLRILRRDRAHSAMFAMMVIRLVAKPIANIPIAPRLAFWHLRTNAHAIRDAFSNQPRFEHRHRPERPH